MAIHRVQQFILAQLSEHDSLRYSAMRPTSMEASQFMYHLRKLIERDLVQKLTDGSYALTPQGRMYIDRADESLSLRAQPRLGAFIVCKRPDKGYLYVQRRVQPALGWEGFPIIDIELGFALPLKDYVQSELEQLTGIKANLQHRADGYINIETDGKLDGSLMAHVFEAEYVSGDLKSSPGFDYVWEKDLQSPPKLLSSSKYVVEELQKQKDFFYFERSFDLN